MMKRSGHSSLLAIALGLLLTACALPPSAVTPAVPAPVATQVEAAPTATTQAEAAPTATVQAEATATPVAETPATTPALSGVYTASLPGPGDGRPVTLTLGIGGDASLTIDQMSGDAPMPEVGTWSAADAMTLTLTLTGTAAQTYEAPSIITFTVNGATLVGVEFSKPEDFGTTGLTVQRVAEPTESSAPAAPDFMGVYTASLPGPGDGRPVTLTLTTDDIAILTTDQMNGEGPVDELGTWLGQGGITVTVSLTGTMGKPYAAPNVITFTLSGDRLTAIDFSQPEMYGTVGLPLQRVASDDAGAPALPDELTAPTWQLVEIVGIDGKSVTPDDPAKYSLAFGADNRITLKADCNQAGGPYYTSDGMLKIGPLISTMAECGEGSLAGSLLTALEQSESYTIQEGNLIITLVAGEGALHFAPAK